MSTKTVEANPGSNQHFGDGRFHGSVVAACKASGGPRITELGTEFEGGFGKGFTSHLVRMTLTRDCICDCVMVAEFQMINSAMATEQDGKIRRLVLLGMVTTEAGSVTTVQPST
jgi:hypothetical protein